MPNTWNLVLRLVCLLVFLLVPPASAQLKALETKDLRLIYIDPTQNYLVPHAARCYLNSLQFQKKLFGYEPREKLTVFLNDFSDFGNAGATSTPNNFVAMQIAPMSFAYEAFPANERINTMANHELVHVFALDQTAPVDLGFRKFFLGKVRETPDHPETILYQYLTAPRLSAPRWYHEGLAVFIETWMAGGIGQAQGSWDEMVFRSMVRDGSRFYDPLGLASEGVKIDFQLEHHSYLYGTRFMSYLAYRYSPEELMRWVTRTKDSKRGYKAQFKHVFGKTLEQGWQDWIAFEREFQEANLAGVRQFEGTPYRPLTKRALGAVSRAYYDPESDSLIAGVSYPGVVSNLSRLFVEDGRTEKIRDVKGPAIFSVTSLAYDPESKRAFYTTDNYDHRDLVSIDVATGKYQVHQKDLRVGDLAFNKVDRSLWGIRHFNGRATLVRIVEPYDDWSQIHSFDYGVVPYDIDVSPDGQYLVASIGQIDGKHALHVMRIESLLQQDTTPVARFDFGTTIPSNFVFDPTGRFLYGSSYYTGVSNIFRYEVANQELEAVSNSETGLFRPVPLGDDRVIAFRYTGEGFVAVEIDAQPLEDVSAITFLGQKTIEKHPVLEDWNVGSPARIDLDSLVTRREDYHGFKSIGVESMYPIVEGYEDFAAYGVSLNLKDPLGLHQASIAASYTPNSESVPDNERLHLELKYKRYDFNVRFTLNNADFYDLFGPTKTSRKGWSLGGGYNKTLIADSPRELSVSASATAFGNLDRLPSYQNVAATFDELYYADVGLSYTNRRISMGAVDHEKGIKAAGYLSESYVDGQLIPALEAELDLGFALPFGHSSIWWRSSAGVADGGLDDPYANFFFGGFGNNYVDHRSIQRYRESYAFPGVELNQIGGRDFAKSMLEWNLPPIRFRRAGSSSFYVTWARPALFVSGIETNLSKSGPDNNRFANAGAQIDFRMTLLSRLNLTLSLGYARAFREGGGESDEFMYSLKVLN